MRLAGGSERTNIMRLKCSDGPRPGNGVTDHHSPDAIGHCRQLLGREGAVPQALEEARGPGRIGLAAEDELVDEVEHVLWRLPRQPAPLRRARDGRGCAAQAPQRHLARSAWDLKLTGCPSQRAVR